MTEKRHQVETVRAGLDPAEAQNIIAQFLIANPNVKALFGTGSVTSTVGAGAIQGRRRRHSLRRFRPCGRDRECGGNPAAMYATMDQQPYLQGYYPIAQIALAKNTG